MMSDNIPASPKPRHFSFKNIEFLKSAPTLAQCPDDRGIEVAFVGRSNAGKSSAINTLTGKNKLARTSKTPGRTQLMNFFQIDEDRRLVDLPGYGYAKVPTGIQRQIEGFFTTYLSQRQCLQGLVLLMDIRHPLMTSDKRLIDFAQEYELPVHILLTKCDKFKRGASQDALLKTRRALTAYKNVTVQTFSSLQHVGIEEALMKLDDWFSFDEASELP